MVPAAMDDCSCPTAHIHIPGGPCATTCSRGAAGNRAIGPQAGKAFNACLVIIGNQFLIGASVVDAADQRTGPLD